MSRSRLPHPFQTPNLNLNPHANPHPYPFPFQTPNLNLNPHPYPFPFQTPNPTPRTKSSHAFEMPSQAIKSIAPGMLSVEIAGTGVSGPSTRRMPTPGSR